MTLKTENITDTVLYREDPKECYKKVFENIGEYIKENAQRYSENIVDSHAGMTIEIEIPINDIVILSVKINEYVVK